MGTSRCAHGYFPGYCFCYEPRIIETLEDAERCYESGTATPLEWERCYAIFFKEGYIEKASDCLVRGIEAIRRPGDQTNLAELVGDYISLQIEKEGFANQRAPWLKNLAEKLRRRQRDAIYNNQRKFASYLDEEIRDASEMAEALILAKDGSKYALVRLAKKLRRPRKYDKFVRWNRPIFALQILNELLEANAKNSFARNCRAAVHLDLGNITDSLADSEASIAQDPKDKAAWLVNASAYLETGDGTKAWRPLLASWSLEKSPWVLAMMFIAIGLISQKGQAVPTGHNSIRDWREWIEIEMNSIVGVDETKRFQIVAQIASLRSLCNTSLFLEALQFLAELEREGWAGFTAFWDQEIRKLARIARPDMKLPPLQALIDNPADYYPDNL
jgi:hypothetical protein